MPVRKKCPKCNKNHRTKNDFLACSGIDYDSYHETSTGSTVTNQVDDPFTELEIALSQPAAGSSAQQDQGQPRQQLMLVLDEEQLKYIIVSVNAALNKFLSKELYDTNPDRVKHLASVISKWMMLRGVNANPDTVLLVNLASYYLIPLALEMSKSIKIFRRKPSERHETLSNDST